MILLGAGATMLAFTLYPQASAVTPWISARYLVGLLIAIPAVLFPLWDKKDYAIKFLRARQYAPAKEPGRPQESPLAYTAIRNRIRAMVGATLAVALARYALTTIILIVALLGTIEIFTTQVPLAQASSASQQTLINRLISMGATRVYTDYDDCNRLAFLSNERIICAVLDDGLQPGLDRYFPYRQEVAATTHPFYLFPIGSVQTFLLEQKAHAQHIGYRKIIMGSYVIFESAQRIAT